MMYNVRWPVKEDIGTEHTSTLETVGNLGILYADQGRLKDAR